jgi:hypothetical protein
MDVQFFFVTPVEEEDIKMYLYQFREFVCKNRLFHSISLKCDCIFVGPKTRVIIPV